METTVSSRAWCRSARKGVVRRLLGLGAVAGLVLAAASPTGAEDACRTNCDDWLAACLKDCANAPVVDECRANCRTLDRMCLDKCDQS